MRDPELLGAHVPALFRPEGVPRVLVEVIGPETAHQVDEEPVVPQQVEMELYSPVLVLLAAHETVPTAQRDAPRLDQLTPLVHLLGVVLVAEHADGHLRAVGPGQSGIEILPGGAEPAQDGLAGTGRGCALDFQQPVSVPDSRPGRWHAGPPFQVELVRRTVSLVEIVAELHRQLGLGGFVLLLRHQAGSRRLLGCGFLSYRGLLGRTGATRAGNNDGNRRQYAHPLPHDSIAHGFTSF